MDDFVKACAFDDPFSRARSLMDDDDDDMDELLDDDRVRLNLYTSSVTNSDPCFGVCRRAASQ